MMTIISGTNRADSNTEKVARQYARLLEARTAARRETAALDEIGLRKAVR